MSQTHPVQLEEATFDEYVKGADRPVLVDFWAEWCGPCKAMEPVLEEVASREADRMLVAKVDVDANPDLATRFGIMAIPTMILFVGGKEVYRIRGAMPAPALMKRITPHLTVSQSTSRSGPDTETP